MSLFSVSPEKEKELFRRMQKMNVDERDLEESFIRSSGPGGQNVNKVSTCVYLLHRPTGISVKCQKTRMQGLNRFHARRLLLDEIEKKRTGVVLKEKQRIEKIRRQKRKRSKRAKEKILELKRQRGEKKASRRSVRLDKIDEI